MDDRQSKRISAILFLMFGFPYLLPVIHKRITSLLLPKKRKIVAVIPASAQEQIQREMEADRPAELPVHPDAAQAMRDFDAGKISGDDLRVAIGVALGQKGP